MKENESVEGRRSFMNRKLEIALRTTPRPRCFIPRDDVRNTTSSVDHKVCPELRAGLVDWHTC